MPDIHRVDYERTRTLPLPIRPPGGGSDPARDESPPADLLGVEADRWLEERDDQEPLDDLDWVVCTTCPPYH